MSNYLMPSFSSLTNGNTEYGLIAWAKKGRQVVIITMLCYPINCSFQGSA